MRLTLQFKRMAFAQVVLGIVAFCMAEPNPGLLLIAGAIAALSWYVTEGPGGKPLPRWLINILSLAAIAWLVHDLFMRQGRVIVAMGHFVMALQVLLLYGPKANRDYAQLLVLSLLQMIGASVLSVSMIYGLLLVGYCVLALITVLLFQLKSTADHVAEANRAAAPSGQLVTPPKAVVGRGHRWHFRITTLVVGLVCGVFAIVMFVAMPRTGDKRFGSDLAGPIAKRETGFSQTVRLGSPMNATATKEPVMNLKVSLHGKTLHNTSSRDWLLRGAALDSYERKERRWRRSLPSAGDPTISLEDGGVEMTDVPATGILLEGQITLRHSDDRTLFTVQPITYFQSSNVSQVQFNPIDQRLAADDSFGGTLVYTIRWPLGLVPGIDEDYRQRYNTSRSWRRKKVGGDKNAKKDKRAAYATGWHVQPQRVAKLAHSALEEAGITPPADGVWIDPEAGRAASTLAEYLRNNYTYSLDYTVDPKQDPVIDFLFDQRRGHCELFASAHAALCRSIGLPARVITGYRASEYNGIGGYFVIRKNHAHAWTEVNCGEPSGWRTYDATPPDLVNSEHRGNQHLFAGLRSLYDHFEYIWLRTIVAYDKRTREAMLREMSDAIETEADNKESYVGQTLLFIRDLPDTWRLDKIGYTAAGIVIVMLGVAIASLARLMILRRRKLVALQLTAVPRSRRRGMTRKLRFYLRMLELLERRGYVRPAWQSPYQFATELYTRYPDRFKPVVALTELFYEVRFGHRDLDHARRDRVKDNLKALERAIAIKHT